MYIDATNQSMVFQIDGKQQQTSSIKTNDDQKTKTLTVIKSTSSGQKMISTIRLPV